MMYRNWRFFSDSIEGSGGTPASPAGEGQPPPSDSPAGSPSKEVMDIWNHDPFAKDYDPFGPTEPEKAPVATEGQGAAPAVPPTVTPPATPPQEPVQTPVQQPAPAAPQYTLSPEQIAQLASESARQAAPQAPPEPEDVKIFNEFGPKDTNYRDWNIPDALANAIGSEDINERKRALAGMASAVATSVHTHTAKEVTRAIRSELARVLPQFVDQRIMGTHAARETHDDFYKAYPEFNSAELKPIVVQVGQQVAQQMGATAWTPALRDAIGQRLRTILNRQPVAQPVAPQSPAPQGMSPPSVRPVVQGNGSQDPWADLMPELYRR